MCISEESFDDIDYGCLFDKKSSVYYMTMWHW